MPTPTEIRANTQSRHREVLGQPPRLLPLDRDLVADQVVSDTQHLRGAVHEDRPPVVLDTVPEIMSTMCRTPDLWRKLMDLTIQIQGTGWLCQAPYEFGEHVNQPKRAGITSEDIERIIVGSVAPGWDEHDRAVVRAVEELHEGAMIGDATWNKLAERLDESQLIELLIVIGQFTATAYFQNSLRLRLEAENVGLDAR